MGISFIIPVFNQQSFTQECLATLQATVPPHLAHEIIIVDNASSDGTREWLTTLRAPIRAIVNDQNLGYGGACNRGVAAAACDHIAILNNDLVFLSRWLEPMLEAAARSPRAVIGNIQLSVRTRSVDHAGVFFDTNGKPQHARPLLASLAPFAPFTAPAVTGACMLMRTETFRELGGFDEHYINGYEDMDFCLRARTAGHEILVAPRSVIFHYVGTSDGRYARESANATRFASAWEAFARTLGVPHLPSEIGASAQHATPAYDPGAHATLQIFHPGENGYSEPTSTVRLYRTGRWTRVRAAVPRLACGDVSLRIDPTDFSGTIRIAGLRLLTRVGQPPVFVARGADQLNKLLLIAGTSIQRGEDPHWLTMESTGNDPQLYFRPFAFTAELATAHDLVLELCLQTTVAGSSA